jgi:hypothetical protein
MRARPVAVHGGFFWKGFFSRRPVGCAPMSLHRARGRTLSDCMSTFPYCCLDRSLQATGEFCIPGERLEHVVS